MRFRILGPLEVRDGTGWTPLPRSKLRTLLATLLINAGNVVATGQLVEELWGEQAPRTARNLVQQYVMRLRRTLQDPHGRLLVTRPPGYQLILPDIEELDAGRFERLLDEGQGALRAGQPERAAGLLADALSLWRGPALADVRPSPAVEAEAARLEEQRLAATELRVDADLARGRHADLIGELRQLVRDHPLRERLWAQLVLALYRSSRQADALAAYREIYQLLGEELGVEPGAPLQRLHQQILRADPALQWPRPPVAGPAPPPPAGRTDVRVDLRPDLRPDVHPDIREVPRQLPADVPGFTGRSHHLSQLDAILEAAGSLTPTAVVITAIAGTAGVGKTALALHWAHQVADRFGDGQLYVNLRGYARIPPLRPIQALAQLLGALGVSPEQIPVDVEQAAGRYRSLLAGRRMLVLLDNAADAAQVRPLLPGSPTCMVLVTSRDRLGGLVARDGAHPMTLDVLIPAEACALVAAIVGDARARAEPDAVAELAHACAHLPLALRIAAANLAARPGEPIAAYAAELTEGNRLAKLSVSGDREATVKAALDLSVQRLTVQERQFFRTLGLAPGPDLTPASSAALTGVRVEQATRLLCRLADAHLLTEHRPGRFAFHDLLRLYAAELAEAEADRRQRTVAVGRLLDWYLDRANAAAELLYPEILRLPYRPPAFRNETSDTAVGRHADRTGPSPQPFASARQALAWLDGERANLVAAVRHAADHGPRQAAWQLADALRGYFWSRRHGAEWLAVARAAVSAARADAAPRGLAAAHLNLADAYQCVGEIQHAAEQYGTALRLAERSGWPEGQGSALSNLGILHMDAGRIQQAAEHFTASLDLQRRSGWRQGEANNLGNLGVVQLMLGRLDEAADHCRRALRLYRQTGSRAGQAGALFYLGRAEHDLGRLDRALDHITHALALTREVGMRDDEVTVLHGLASVHRDLGDHTRARELAETALTLAREVGEPRLEAAALHTLATVHHRLGDDDQAATLLVRAVQLTRAVGGRYTEAQDQLGLADAYRRQGRHGAARTCARRALVTARRDGYQVLEGQALTALAGVHLDRGRPDLAILRARQALAIHRQTGHRLGQARALTTLGDATHHAHGTQAAHPHWRNALTLFTETGATGDATHLRTHLTTRT